MGQMVQFHMFDMHILRYYHRNTDVQSTNENHVDFKFVAKFLRKNLVRLFLVGGGGIMKSRMDSCTLRKVRFNPHCFTIRFSAGTLTSSATCSVSSEEKNMTYLVTLKRSSSSWLLHEACTASNSRIRKVYLEALMAALISLTISAV